MTHLSTHGLDTASGRPAAGLTILLSRCGDRGRQHLKTIVTNAEGRTGEPLLSGDGFAPGVYELVFLAGEYFRAQGVPLADPPFLDEIVIRFGIADAHASYHVPLLLSPYSYSTYRGS